MTSIEVSAPAKINIFLKILGKRQDGYHNILTLFERISLADSITISKIPQGISVRSDKYITSSQADNIAYKAAALLIEKKKIKCGVSIYIKKNIPIAAGMGGGSSDCASVLTGMNKLFKLNLTRSELMRLGSSLGSDVSFFLMDTQFAIGRGRGHLLRSVLYKKPIWHIIVNPGYGVSTRDIYREYDKIMSEKALHKDLTRKRANATIRLPLDRTMDFVSAKSMLYNDLGYTLAAKNAAIGRFIRRLASILSNTVTVSGSGSSAFCLYRTRKEALRGRDKLLKSMTAGEKNKWQVFAARTR